jgi:folylpolyglutamate synthase/dihydropteroate synthase
LNGTIHGSVKQALQNALRTAGNNDLVFIGGSIFVVAEAI